MSLAKEIRSLQEKMLPGIPEPVLQDLLDSTERLGQTGIADRALQVGDELPHFVLPNAVGKQVSSEALLRDGPLVISFYRGGWCPYCNLELHALQQALPEIEAQGATLLAITPETPDHSLSTKEKHGLQFEVLTDVGNDVARKLGLVFALEDTIREHYTVFGFALPDYNGDESWELPIPATLVIACDGRVAWRFVDADYTKRGEPSEVVAALKALAAA